MIKLIWPARLRQLGILGMNRRNISFIGTHNKRKNYHLADNKLATKSAALSRGLPVPKLYGTIEAQSQIKSITAQLRGCPSFVIKPAQGSGGKGILVVAGRADGLFVKSSGLVIDEREIHKHTSNILAGLYSLGGRNDSAMIEALIDFDPRFQDYSVEGVPDIRIIVFRGVPVMAMMRCATHASDGKANLHQGAVGVGLDIGTGQSLHAVQYNRVICQHPDSGVGFSDLAIPHWQQVLDLAASCAGMTGLDYFGADIVLDRQGGPMLLELNARPGLAIQVANQVGLRRRLTAASEIADRAADQAEKIQWAREQFTLFADIAGQLDLAISRAD
ncbi:MAG: alpha-L-glutamate ligase-like protein [Porticoccaceae bacterium]